MAESSPLEKCAAYHEAGHMVTAAVYEFAICPSGIHIYHCGRGVSYFATPYPELHPAPKSESERKMRAMIVVLLAGQLAQSKFSPKCPCQAGSEDETEIKKYLFAIYCGRESDGSNSRNDLTQESQALVDRHWPAIDKLANALLAGDWIQRPPESDALWPDCADEMTLDGNTIGEVLKQFDIHAEIHKIDADCRARPQRMPEIAD